MKIKLKDEMVVIFIVNLVVGLILTIGFGLVLHDWKTGWVGFINFIAVVAMISRWVCIYQSRKKIKLDPANEY